MATAIFSDRYARGNAGTPVTVSTSATYIPASLGLSASGTGTLYRVEFQLLTPTAAPAANDLWYLGQLPLGYTLNSWFVDFAGVDSNATAAFAGELGDSTTAGKYVATGTAAAGNSSAGVYWTVSGNGVHSALPNMYSAYKSSGSRSQTSSATGINFEIGIADDLIFTVTHAAATYAGGSGVFVQGYYDLVLAEYPLGSTHGNY